MLLKNCQCISNPAGLRHYLGMYDIQANLIYLGTLVRLDSKLLHIKLGSNGTRPGRQKPTLLKELLGLYWETLEAELADALLSLKWVLDMYTQIYQYWPVRHH